MPKLLLHWNNRSRNTLKFLISISPTGFITFLSNTHGGRASDKSVSGHSEFVDYLDSYDEIMTYRGFQITE